MRADALSAGRPRSVTGRMVFVAVVAFFVVVAAVNGVMIYFAVATFPGVEVDSSYRAGLDYPEELAAAHAQAARGWRVGVATVRHDDGVVTLALDVRDAKGAPVGGLAGNVVLKRPSDIALDRTASLVEGETGRYTATIADTLGGRYDLAIDLEGSGDVRFRSLNHVMLNPPGTAP